MIRSETLPGLLMAVGRNPYPPREPSEGEPSAPVHEPRSRIKRFWDDVLPIFMFIVGTYFFYLEFTTYGARPHVLLAVLGFVIGPTGVQIAFKHFTGRKG